MTFLHSSSCQNTALTSDTPTLKRIHAAGINPAGLNLRKEELDERDEPNDKEAQVEKHEGGRMEGVQCSCTTAFLLKQFPLRPRRRLRLYRSRLFKFKRDLPHGDLDDVKNQTVVLCIAVTNHHTQPVTVKQCSQPAVVLRPGALIQQQEYQINESVLKEKMLIQSYIMAETARNFEILISIQIPVL